MQNFKSEAIDSSSSEYLDLNGVGFLFLILFGVGCGVSNSLVSISVHLWSFFAIFWIVKNYRRQSSSLFVDKDRTFLTGLSYVTFTLIFLLILAPRDNWNQEIGAWLLFLYWVIGFSKTSVRLSEQKLLQVDRIVAVAYVGLWLVCMYQHFGVLNADRVNGVHNNPNRLACAILPPLIYFGERIFYGAYKKKFLENVLFVLLWMLLIHIVFLTRTRSIFPFVIIYSGSLVVRTLRRYYHPRINKAMVGAGLLALLIVFGVVIVKSGTASRFDFTKLSQDGNVLSRLEFWRLNWNMFLKSPLWGTGFRQNLLNVADHPGLQPYMELQGRSFLAHNTYVQVLAESGIIGFTLFFSFLTLVFLRRPHLRWFVFSILLVGIADTSIHLARTMPPMIFFSTMMGFFEPIKKRLLAERV